MTSFLFSPHENLIWCYSVAAAEGTAVVYDRYTTHRAAVCTSYHRILVCLVPRVLIQSRCASPPPYIPCSPLRCQPHTNGGGLRELSLPPGGERRALGEDTGGRPVSGQSLRCDPTGTGSRTSQDKSPESDEENNPGGFLSPRVNLDTFAVYP